MKTLGEIENEVKIVSNAFVIVALSKKRDQPDALVTANRKQAELFASLAQWDAVVQEALPQLRNELTWLLDDTDFFGDDTGLKRTTNKPGHCELTPAGLARLEHLRGLLGEEG